MRGILVAIFVWVFVVQSTGRAAPIAFKDAYQDGFVLTFWHENYTATEINQVLQRIRSTGARHLTIAYFGCQPGKYSDDVDSCVTIHTRPFMLQVARQAIMLGFSTSFLPIVGTKDGTWRGQFEPRDLDRWFASYTRWITWVAKASQDLGMKEVVVGTEFNSLSRYEDRWKSVFAKVRGVFRGPIVMTMNWDDLDNHHYWDEVDAIGVSGYFILSDNPGPSQAELVQSWTKHRNKLLSLSRLWNRPVHMTEVGYHNAITAAKRPWGILPGDPVDQFMQTFCYQAFAQTWESEKDLVRANFWSTSGIDADGKQISMEPLGRPAEKIIRQFFDSRRQLGILKK